MRQSEKNRPPHPGEDGLLHRETGLQVDLDRARAEIRSLQAKLAAATLGGTDAERLHDLEAAGRDARDWIVEAMSRRSNGDVDEVLALAHGRLEAMNLGDGDPDAEARAHAYPDDSAGADEGRVAALERAIVEAEVDRLKRGEEAGVDGVDQIEGWQHLELAYRNAIRIVEAANAVVEAKSG